MHKEVPELRFLAAALLCAVCLHASETEESIHRSLPVSSATRLRLDADWGTINVKPSASPTVDVEVHFRGDPPSAASSIACSTISRSN